MTTGEVLTRRLPLSRLTSPWLVVKQVNRNLGKPIKISTGRFGGDKERIGKVWAFSARSTPFAQVLRNSTRSPCTPNCTLHSLKNSLEPANDPIPLVPRGLTVRLGVCNAFQSLVGGSCIRLPAFSTEASGKAREQRKSGAERTRTRAERETQSTFRWLVWFFIRHIFLQFSFLRQWHR